MKKSKISVLLCGLAMMLAMYNCKKEETFPSEPPKDLVDKINAITVATVTIDKPAAVTATAATAEASAKATEVNGDLANIASSGTVPASVSGAATAVNAALPAADVATLAAVTPQTIAAIAAGGAPSAALKTVMDKVATNPALQAYLPKFTLPTVAGKTISGRVGAIENIEQVEKVLVDDACVASAEATYQAAKAKLDASKSTQDAAVAASYATDIAPLAGNEASCKAAIPATFATYRGAIQVQIDKALADLNAAKAVLGDLYPVLQALVNIQAIGAFAGLNQLEAASIAACTATTVAATTNAQATRDANLAKVKAAYDTAIAAAVAAKADLVKSCHNQGGGN